MITGQITLYPKFEMNKDLQYKELKNLTTYINIPCHTTDGIEIYITLSEELYNLYSEQIMLNKWGDNHKFRVWGEIRSISEATAKAGLSNLYIRVNDMKPDYSDKNVNLFWINAHGTKTSIEDVDSKYFWVAANKSILNKNEKRNKPSYCFLKTDKNNDYKNKDIIQGNVRLSYDEDKQLYLEELYTVKSSTCRKLVEHFMPEYKNAI